MELAPIPKTNDIMRLADWIELYLLTSSYDEMHAEQFVEAISEGDLCDAPPPYDQVAEDELDDIEAAMQIDERGRQELDFADYDMPTYELAVDAGSPEQTEVLSRDVYSELSGRARTAQVAYPFEVEVSKITLRKDWVNHTPYIFCLMLANYGHLVGPTAGEDCRRLFETLAVRVARRFVSAEGVDACALRFGFPRDGAELPSSFQDAVSELVARIGEGQGARRRSNLEATKDGRLDIVAWRHFPDGAPGKLVLFGACASNWDIAEIRRRAGDLQVDIFLRRWFLDPPPTPVLNALFIPHRLRTDDGAWGELTREAGIVFERCRLAWYAEQDDDGWDAHRAWLALLLPTIAHSE